MSYLAHDSFVAPARTYPQIWRLIIGLLVAAGIYLAVFLAFLGMLALVSGFEGAERWLQQMGSGDSPTATLLLLGTFIGMALGPFAATRWLHKRRIATLFGPRRKALRHFLITLLVAAALFALSLLIPSGIEIEPNLPVSLWASFLPLALVGVLIQTGAEEVLFRGYLQQQLAARFSSPFVWMVLPSLLFGFAHFDPATMGTNAWLIVAATGLFGLFAADLTAKTGTLGAAWGFHFANNVLALLVVGLDGPLSGLALYTTSFGPEAAEILRPLIYRDMAITAAIWLAIRYILTR